MSCAALEKPGESHLSLEDFGRLIEGAIRYGSQDGLKAALRQYALAVGVRVRA